MSKSFCVSKSFCESLCVRGRGTIHRKLLQFEILVGGVGERKERMLVLR